MFGNNYTVPEFAEMLGVSVDVINDAILNKEIRTANHGLIPMREAVSYCRLRGLLMKDYRMIGGNVVETASYPINSMETR